MKTKLLTLALALGFITLPAQNAVDFTANDCAGNSHNLFSELNSGRVIVISWVMPCGGCIAASQTAYGVVQSYASSNPGQVSMYIVDDYGNTACNTLTTWANNNGMPLVTTFSDATIDMTGYGGVGMPKIIVVGGGYNHTLYFNENNSAANDATGIQNAIDSALVDATGITNPVNTTSAISLFPNPGINSSVLTITASSPSKATVEVYNTLGEKVLSVFDGTLQQGENRLNINTEGLAAGSYIVRITEGEMMREERLTVAK
jgi:hypothetical protein